MSAAKPKSTTVGAALAAFMALSHDDRTKMAELFNRIQRQRGQGRRLEYIDPYQE